MASLSPVDTILFYSFFVFGTLGLLFSIALLILMFIKTTLRQGDYASFIITRAFMDSSSCLNFLILQPLGVLYWTTNPTWCTAAAAVGMASIVGLIASEPILAFNRFIAVCYKHKYQTLFRKRTVFLLCLAPWVIGVLVTIPQVVHDSLGRVPGYFCLVKYEYRYLWMVIGIDYSVLFGSYVITTYCYCRIFLVLRRHQQQDHHDSLQATRLQEDRSILRYIGAAALLPLVADTPVALAGVVRMYDPTWVSDYVMVFGNCLYFCCPLLNPVLTFLMVRPIRKELRAVLKRMVTTNQVEPRNPVSACAEGRMVNVVRVA